MRSPLTASYHITVENGKRTLISDCKQIIEYSPEKITLMLTRAQITLIGDDLTLSDFFGEEVQIRGKIKSITIEGEANEK